MPFVESGQQHLWLDTQRPVKAITQLHGRERLWAQERICAHHYLHSVPSGKSVYMQFEDALMAWTVPANPFLTHYVLGYPGCCWELARLWAPDQHAPNLLTQALAAGIGLLKRLQPSLDVVVAFADPNAGHVGYVYRAASWVYLGQSEETRVYLDAQGQMVARRHFHSGKHIYTKHEIQQRGYREILLPGKQRYARFLSRRAKKRAIALRNEAKHSYIMVCEGGLD